MVDNIVAIGALLISLLTMVGGGFAYLSERKRRLALQKLEQARADGQDITNLTTLSQRITDLEDERQKDYDERRKLRDDLWAAQGRIYSLEQQQEKDEVEREGLKRLLTVAIEYIDVVCDQLVSMGGKPPARPPEITAWLNNHEGDE